MAFSIPDKGTANNDIQSIFFSEYLDILLSGIGRTDVVLSGGAVSANASPNLNLPVEKSGVLTNGVLKAVAASNVTISAANSSYPRLDMVVVDNTGALQVRAGTPSVAPSPPALNGNDVALACVFIPQAATTVVSNQIVDMRVRKNNGPVKIFSNNGMFVNNSSTITPYINLTIPAGTFVAGDIMRVSLGGWYQSNGGTGVLWTSNINFGGVTLFADNFAAASIDVDRGAWSINFNITAISNTSQAAGGIISFQTPGAKTAPATGIAGDQAVVTHVAAPFRGVLGTANTNNINPILLVQWTMNVANTQVQTTMDYATVELF